MNYLLPITLPKFFEDDHQWNLKLCFREVSRTSF
jgi:hypothetical protein